ncbi:MAG: hypothetical protein LBS07_01195 [Prevotellaceae bacterium]|jgi:hypothetical protein|nr:hypothetical protein [Prevotellaceae bacterium]
MKSTRNTGNFHYFNPGHEAAVLNASPYYMPPAHVAQMQRDLAFLPAWYASDGDYVLVEQALPNDFRNYLNEIFGLNVRAVTGKDLPEITNQINGCKVHLWGVSPQSIRLFETLDEKFNLNLSIPRWKDSYAGYCHRRRAAEWLSILCRQLPGISSQLVPRFYTSVESIEDALQKESGTAFLAKAPYSSSGRGLLWLPKGGLTRTERQILHGIIKKQKSVALEYVLRKTTDFAMEFTCENGFNSEFTGYSLFKTNSKGAYDGNIIASQSDIKQIINKQIGNELIEKVKNSLMELINIHLIPFYTGYAGVDMMIYEQNGNVALHPCVEINLRSNMGIIALNLQKHIASGSQGYFKIEFASQQGKLYRKHKEYEQRYPLLLSGGKIVSGYFPLCPVSDGSHYTAYATAGRK